LHKDCFECASSFLRLCFFSDLFNVLKRFWGKMVLSLRVLLVGVAIRNFRHSI
jgi:hypothetical protein